MKSFIFVLVILMVATKGFSQEERENFVAPQVPKLILRSDILALINVFKPSAFITADYRISPQQTIDVGFGYFFNAGEFFISKQGEYYRGPQFRIGAKHYFRNNENNPRYFGFEVKHHRITHNQWVSMLRQGGQYSEDALIPRLVNTWGGTVRIGQLFYLGPSKKYIFDTYFALGINRHDVNYNIPKDAQPQITSDPIFNFLIPDGVSIVPSFIIGLHIGFAFW